MKQVKLYPKVAFDLFYEQAKWSAWFLAILAAIHIVVLYFNRNSESEIAGFFVFSSYSTSIFMLVCGIMSAYVFLSYYVQRGISRKDTFRGTALAAVGLALALTVIPLLLNGIEYLLSPAVLPMDFAPLSSFGSGFGWLWASLFYFLNILTFYMIGWMISIGYYRYGWLTGFLFIALAIIAFSLNDYFRGDDGLTTFIPWLPTITAEAAPLAGAAGAVVLIAVLLIFIHYLTKRVAIKM